MKKKVMVGDVAIGGDSPISIQSMANTDTRDARATIEQIHRLEEAGCEIVRVAVPDMEAAEAFAQIKNNIKIPLVADIHFDYRLALEVINKGADKVRINPGNIGSRERVKAVADACRKRGIPIRIGVNGGSLEKELLEKYGSPCADALVESALRHIEILHDLDFGDIVVSIKVSDVPTMLEAYRKFDKISDIPLHIGVTESGTLKSGMIKSSAGIGALLADNIGNTMRVSLTADPIEEVYLAKDILRVMGKRASGAMLVSCPTCGRTRIDLISLAEKVEKMIADIDEPIKVAVMGCAVNGPGEAREADIGIAGGNGEGIIFKKGEILRKVSENEILSELKAEIDKLLKERTASR